MTETNHEAVPPVACTLDPALMPWRGDGVRALGQDGLVSIDRQERDVTLRFRPDAAIRQRVASIVAAESKCCAFLDFAITDDQDATILKIAAPEGAEQAVHELADLFSADTEVTA